MNAKHVVAAAAFLLPIFVLWSRSRIAATGPVMDSGYFTSTPDSGHMSSCHAGIAIDTTGDLLLVIISDQQNFEKREYLRSTWARQNDIFPVIRFFVGKSNQDSDNNDLEEEAKHFGDVCIMQLTDNYATLPAKVCGCSNYRVPAYPRN